MDETPAILIVDSNLGFAMMLKESLEQDQAYQATVAQAGDEALAIASEESFDLAIVDLGIETVDDLDGEAVARQLRQGQADLRLMLIPLEGEVLPEELADLNVQGTLPKPFFLPDLPDLLDAALTRPLGEPREPAPPPQAPAPRLSGEEPRPAVAVGSLDVLHECSPQVVQELEALAREVNADAVLLIRGDEILGSVGRLKTTDLNTLAHIISQSCQLSGQLAQVLGREQRHLELSVEGDEHTLYSLTVVEDILLSAVLRPDVTLGFLRHRAKATVRCLHDLVTG